MILLGVAGDPCSIDGTTICCGVTRDDAAAHNTSFQEIECTALSCLTSGNQTVAHMGTSWYDGCTAHTVITCLFGCITINQSAAVYYSTVANGIFEVGVYFSRRPFAKGHGVITIHLLGNGSSFFHLSLGTQYGLISDAVALVLVPVVGGWIRYTILLRTLVVSTHQPNSVRNQEGIALWNGRVSQGVGMINETVSAFVCLITGYLHINLYSLVVVLVLVVGSEFQIFVCFFKFLASLSQHALQFVSAGCVFRTVAATVSVTILGYVVNVGFNLTFVVLLYLSRNVGCIICLVGADINLAVFDTVGIVHIGFRKFDTCSYISRTAIQTFVASQTIRFVQTEVIG